MSQQHPSFDEDDRDGPQAIDLEWADDEDEDFDLDETDMLPASDEDDEQKDESLDDALEALAGDDDDDPFADLDDEKDR